MQADTGWAGYREADAAQELLRRVRQHDAEAFEELFLRHYALVYQVLVRLVGERLLAEDLAQETFLALYQSPPSLVDDRQLRAWLCRVALNRGYNALRSQRRAQSSLQRTTPEEVHLDPDAEVLRREEQAHVRTALAQLSERQGKLLALRYAGFSYAEIATILELRPNSVGTLLVRAERAFVMAYDELTGHEGHDTAS